MAGAIREFHAAAGVVGFELLNFEAYKRVPYQAEKRLCGEGVFRRREKTDENTAGTAIFRREIKV
jgi:hypothetical protein